MKIIDKKINPKFSLIAIPIINWMIFLFFLLSGCIYTGGRFSASYSLCWHNNNLLYSWAMVFFFFAGIAFTIYGVYKYKNFNVSTD